MQKSYIRFLIPAFLCSIFFIMFCGKEPTNLEALEPFGTPALTFPIDKNEIMQDSLLFIWDAVDGAEKYALQVSSVNNSWDENLILNVSDLDSSNYSLKENEKRQFQSRTYFWRVRVITPDPGGEWSSPEQFSLKSISRICVNKTRLEFGEIVIDDAKVDSFTITNMGDARLDVQSIVGLENSPFEVLTSLPFVVEKGDSIIVRVQFQPIEAGKINAILKMTTNDPYTQVTELPLSGIGKEKPVAKINIEPDSLDFGATTIGTDSVKTFFVCNTGDALLTVNSIEMMEPTSDQFKILTSIPFNVAIGATYPVLVRFKPTRIGDMCAVLSIQSNDPDSPEKRLSLTGIGREQPVAQIDIKPNDLTFADTFIGNTTDSTITVYNRGDEVLAVSLELIGADKDQFEILANALFTVASGDSHRVIVRFQPTGAGLKSSILKINSTDPDEPEKEIPLSGTGVKIPAPNIVIEPESLKFEDTVIGNSKHITITVSNMGDTFLEVNEIEIEGAGKEHFEAETNLPLLVGSGEAKQVLVHFKPSMAGGFVATLKMTSNDPDEPVKEISISGIGKVPPEPNITVDRQSLDFGEAVIGGIIRIDSFNVCNAGDALLVVSMEIDGPDKDQFEILFEKSFDVSNGFFHEVGVCFTPTKVGIFQAVLKMTSNDPDEPEIEMSLYGIGKGKPAPHIFIEPEFMDFGSVVTGSFMDSVLTIHNKGDAALEVSNLELSGDDKAYFDVPDKQIFNVASDESYQIRLRFMPMEAKDYNSTLTISSNDPDSAEIKLQLKGIGIVLP